VKFLRCNVCGEMLFLTRHVTRSCDCGRTFGRYNPDGDTAIISADSHCHLYGLDNRVFIRGRAETWRYDESNGKIRRVDTERECAS
jgi:hypothetical protein